MDYVINQPLDWLEVVGEGLATIERRANGVEDDPDEVHAKYQTKKDEKKQKLLDEILNGGQ